MEFVPSKAVFQEETDAFLKWIQQQRDTTISPKVRIADLSEHDQGRGVVAVQDIDENEELFTIPFSCILTVKNSNFHKHNQEDLQSLPNWAALVLTMIYEHGKGSNSRWAPYLSLFPAKLDTLMYWSPSELAELQASSVLEKIGKESADEMFETQLWPIAKANVSQFGCHADSFVRVDGKADFLKICHLMASTIFAYGFDLDLDMSSDEEWQEDDDDHRVDDFERGMVPLADLLNADGDLNNAHLVQNEDSVTMTAIKPIKAGDQIFNDFGALPRSELLRCYGYITDRYKEWDVVEIPLTLIMAALDKTTNREPHTEEDKETRLSLADDWRVLDDSYELTWPPASKYHALVPPNMILIVNALQISARDLEEEKASKNDPLETGVFMRSLGMYLTWRGILAKRLQQYKSTIAEDKEILRATNLKKRHRMAVEIRLGEKEILARWLDEISLIIKNISAERQENFEEMQAMKKRKL